MRDVVTTLAGPEPLEPSGTVAVMIDAAILASLASHWEEGWNGGDVERIMAPFAADVVFSSPYVAKWSGDPGRRTVEGHTALRGYVADALTRSGDVRYRLDAVLGGAESVVLVYTCTFPDATTRPGADVMRVGPNGLVVEWRCHYATDPATWRP